jgi:hypothetical protein
MIRYWTILITFLFSIALPVFSDAEIYKWVDDRGNVHFADNPPEGSEMVYETLGEVSSSSRKEAAHGTEEARLISSTSALYSGKPIYFWRDQFETLNSKIAMKQRDIRLLKSAIDKTDMYQPEKTSGMIIYPRELRVDGRLLNSRAQFIEEWTRQTERLRELEEERQALRDKAESAGVPRWVWKD